MAKRSTPEEMAKARAGTKSAKQIAAAVAPVATQRPTEEALEHNHSLFGPSAICRRILCPASWRLEATMPDKITEESSDGTICHAAIFGPRGMRNDNLNPEQYDLVEKCRTFRDEHTPADGFCEVERLMELRGVLKWPGKLLTWGRPDWAWIPNEAGAENCRPGRVIDWKFYHTPLKEKAVIVQGAIYALMVLRRYGLPEVQCWVYSPRFEEFVTVKVVAKVTDQPVTGAVHLLSASWVEQKVVEIIQECLREDAPYVPGEYQCAYCRGFALCPAVHQGVTELGMVAAGPLAPGPTLSKKLEVAKLARKWADAVEDQVREMMKSGLSVPGWKLEEARGKRTVPNPVHAYARLSAHLTREEFLTAMEPSIGMLEELYVKEGLVRQPERTKQDLKAEFNLVMGDAIQRNPNYLKLVRDTTQTVEEV